MLLYFFFFFSSRRRHTRYWRDWSSDVCSSDLSRRRKRRKRPTRRSSPSFASAASGWPAPKRPPTAGRERSPLGKGQPGGTRRTREAIGRVTGVTGKEIGRSRGSPAC